MENNYKRTVAGSVGAGVGALFNAQGHKYYILEHKTDSKYYRAGDSQKIIVDQIELGRDASCQVRFDESMETVSRKHAAIVRDGENYKLIPMSQTNATLVNGQPVTGEWHLNSGDEIRLSSKGPVLGFIIPQGTQSSVKSIGLTERMSLFRQQALRPYKQALVAVVIVLILAIVGVVYWSQYQMQMNEQTLYNAQSAVADAKQNVEELKQEIAANTQTVITDKQSYNDAIYYIKANNIEVYSIPGNRLLVDFNVEDGKQFHGGTGFMLEDGRFVTARRVIEPWLYYNSSAYDHNGKLWTYRDILRAVKSGAYRVVAHFTAYSPSGMNFQFRNTDFRTYGGYSTSSVNDWATMAKRDQLLAIKGLSCDEELSIQPEGGKPVVIAGYPQQYGFTDSQSLIPVYQQNNINVSGLNIHGVIELSSRRYQEGNDGSPVFINKNGSWVVVGILSHADDIQHDLVVPIYNTNN